MDRYEQESGADPSCFFEWNGLRSLLAKHIKCWSWKPVTGHNKVQNVHVHPSSWSRLPKIDFNRLCSKENQSFCTSQETEQSQSPIQRNQSYGNLWAVHLHWQKMNGRSCWESDTLFQHPQLKWGTFTPKRGGNAGVREQPCSRLQARLAPSLSSQSHLSFSAPFSYPHSLCTPPPHPSFLCLSFSSPSLCCTKSFKLRINLT